jgi:hypothetical protein
MKIRPGEAEFFHADVETAVTKLLTVAFRNSANSSKSVMKLQIRHIIFL